MSPDILQSPWYIVAAFGAAWVLLSIFYFCITERRQRRLREQIAALESQIRAGELTQTVDASDASREKTDIPVPSPLGQSRAHRGNDKSNYR